MIKPRKPMTQVTKDKIRDKVNAYYARTDRSVYSGSNANAWKDKVGYGGVHWWLNNKHKKKGVCENKECEVPVGCKTQWALKPNKKYEKVRDNFLELCVSCHRKMDNKINGFIPWNKKELKAKEVSDDS